MGIVARLLSPQAMDRNPANDFWFTDIGTAVPSMSGVSVGAHTALQASPVWAAVRLLAESVAMMPLIVYRRRSDGGKERAWDHPLYDLLHDAPNPIQTAFAWKRLMMVHALLWGNAYSEILPGPRGPVDQLMPLHPDRVRVEQIPGGIRYQVHRQDGRWEPVNDEDMFHLPGLSLDGVSGLSVLRYARESIGLHLSAKGQAARSFGQGLKHTGVFKHPGKMSEPAQDRFRKSVQDLAGGWRNAGAFLIVEEGMEWIKTGMTNEEAEMIAQLDWSVPDCARYFNVPLHMIQQESKDTSWGSGIEGMKNEFVTFSVMPWGTNWQDTIRKDLIVANRLYFAEFLTEALLRGNTKDRYEAYQIAVGGNGPWMTRNEVRVLENMNPLPGLDEPLQPLNMGPGGTSQAALAEAARSNGHLRTFLRDAAARVVRKEIAAMDRAAKRAGDVAAVWRQEVEAFYSDHGAFVTQLLRIGGDEADGYVAEQRADLLAHGPSAMDGWEPRRIDDLVKLALGGDS